MTHALRRLVFLSVMLSWTATVAGQPLSMLLAPPTLRINPVTGTGMAILRLQNAEPKPMNVVLTGVPVSENLPHDVRITFAREGAASGEITLATTLQPLTIESVVMKVEKVTQPGDYSIDLFNGTTKIGTVTTRRTPIGVSVDTPAEGQSLTLTDGNKVQRILTNGDPFPYTVTWHWSANGHELCSGTTSVPAHDSLPITCSPTVEWSLRELARQQTVASNFTMSIDTNQPSGKNVFRQQVIQATLTSLDPSHGALASYVLLVLVLIAGGLASLALNAALPNFLQKVSLREQLLGLAVRIGNLSNNIESRIRVLIRLERNRLIDLLRSRWTLSPEFVTVVAQSTKGIAQLGSRVEALQQLDLVVQQLYDARLGDVPPTLVEEVEAQLRKANTILVKTEPTDDDLHDAADTIAKASPLVDALRAPGEEFGVKLVARVKAVVDLAKSLDTLPAWGNIKAAVAWPWNAVTNVGTAATVPPAQYAQLDGAVRRVEIMQQYAQLKAGRPGKDSPEMTAHLAALTQPEKDAKLEKLQQLEDHEAALFTCLVNPSYGALVCARRLLREIGEEVYSDDLKKALSANPPEAGISVDPEIVFERAPLTFCVEFYDQFLNDAAARQDWTCEWDFGDNLKAKGWAVSHYFVLPKNSRDAVFEVRATVRDAEGKLVQVGDQPVTLKKSVKVLASHQGARFESRVWAEAAKLAAALLIAIFGLVAGAQEQLLKLDVLPGLIAVFLLGFGADTIKNLLTKT
jgi:hypothetical protein